MNPLITEVKKKKEFSQLPNSLIERALGLTKSNVKEARALLRKYFGVFLTNKVLKLEDEKILKSHVSSKNRNYKEFYEKILEKQKNLREVLDVGCGVNGFSYGFLKENFGDIIYTGLEAIGQIVDKSNKFFREKNFEKAKVFHLDIFDLNSIENFLKESESPKAIFLFQILDALEAFEKDFSKKLLLLIKKYLKKEDLVVITMPTKSLSGKKKFETKREWLRYFLKENFEFREFFIEDERVFICWLK
ncbi:MAG: hypothetical protein QXX68_01730 [Candidatus Pacearchaeota archaeon]